MEIMIPARNIPVLTEADVCVIGGGTTGVFAALRAARRGAKTVLIERGNRPGGTATLSLVCYWHTLFDLSGKRRIISGLTQEVIDRLARRDAVKIHEPDNPSYYVTLNTEELSIELEEMLREAGVEIFYHTMFLAPLPELRGIRVGGKNGEYAILAKRFVDASGDGDLIYSLNLPMWSNPAPQPPSCCAKLSNYPFETDAAAIGELIHRNAARYGLPEGHIWGCPLHNSPLYFLSGTKVAGLNVAGIRELSRAETEGRRQLRAILDIIAEAGYPRPTLEALPSLLGIRDSRHIHALYRVTDDDLLSGRAFPDAVAAGTYRLDVHQQNPPGTEFRYLDGRREFQSPHQPPKCDFWRDPALPTPPFYQIPLRCLIPAGTQQVIAAGRMVDAETGAFGAIRVMVNLNQLGEAAGATAALSLERDCDIAEVPAAAVQAELAPPFL